MSDKVLAQLEGDYGTYEVVDTVYNGRPARVLFSGTRRTAQSGLALDDKPELLFDYNERFMELLRGLKPRRILLIGGGAYTLPSAIQKDLPQAQLTVIELNPELYPIARQHFGFKPNPQTELITGDGVDILSVSPSSFDFIIIDAFINDVIPAGFRTTQTAHQLQQRLSDKGVLAMNIIASLQGLRAEALSRQISALETAFNNLQLYPAGIKSSRWLPQNLVLTAQNMSIDLRSYLRYLPIPISEVSMLTAFYRSNH